MSCIGASKRVSIDRKSMKSLKRGLASLFNS